MFSYYPKMSTTVSMVFGVRSYNDQCHHRPVWDIVCSQEVFCQHNALFS